MTKTFDICIIGAGIAGTFAAYRIAEKHKDQKTILIDVGKPPMKRRRQLEGFLGCFPTGDGKIYPDDLDLVKTLADGRRANPAYNWVFSKFKEVNSMRLTKTNKLSKNCKNRINNNNYDFNYHDYYQWMPKSVHDLSKIISAKLENSDNITFSFDNFVNSIKKNKDTFVLDTSNGSVLSRKIIICVGRSGWRWATNLYDDLGIISNDDYARFGVRLEVPSKLLSEFNKSHISLFKEDIEIGPLSWNGTVIQEDHSDLVISTFRSNEPRWKTNKVSFSLMKKVFFDDQGSVQADRIGKLSFVLFNDRVSREKVSLFMKNKSQLNYIPEYNWLKEELLSLENLIPGIVRRGYFHVPEINPKPAEIHIGSNLETEIDGMFVAGESAGIKGIAAAATMGVISADSACR